MSLGWRCVGDFAGYQIYLRCLFCILFFLNVGRVTVLLWEHNSQWLGTNTVPTNHQRYAKQNINKAIRSHPYSDGS